MQKGRQEGIEETKSIFKLLMQGYTVQQIADELEISEEQIQSIIS